MIRRLGIYYREMYPLLPRLFLGFLLFLEIYFLVILTSGITSFNLGIQEVVGSVTIFLFLMFLRIADDLKDQETDARLFPERPIPSGRVKAQDLYIAGGVVVALMVILNVAFMSNLAFFFFLLGYGGLMSVWFFQRAKIQPNLPLALVTHNPVQLVMNLYAISFACIKYGVPLLSFSNLIILFTLYWPGLVWEISRKIRAPQDETDYVTYSKLFGYKKAVRFVLIVMFLDMITSSLLVYQLLPPATITVIVSYLWLCWKCLQFMDDPTRFKLVSKVELYEYVTEGTMVLIELVFIVLYLL